MAKGSAKDFDRQLERMMTGPELVVLAPESNIGRVVVHVDGDETTLVPGQSYTTAGHGIVMVCEKGGDACHVTVA